MRHQARSGRGAAERVGSTLSPSRAPAPPALPWLLHAQDPTALGGGMGVRGAGEPRLWHIRVCVLILPHHRCVRTPRHPPPRS